MTLSRRSWSGSWGLLTIGTQRKSIKGSKYSDFGAAEIQSALSHIRFAVTKIRRREEHEMRLILLIIVILLLVGALPTWPYSSGWGYYPSGGIGLVLLILVILLLMGRI